MIKANRSTRSRGFTLVELLVVIAIIGLVAVITLPTVLPALQHRQVSEAARILQASIEGARDAAIRANAPRGIRLLPDQAFPGTTLIPMLAASRIVPIEPAGDYSEGMVSIRTRIANRSGIPGVGDALAGAANCIEESLSNGVSPNPRTSWYWNVRVGDRIQVGGAGPIYTIIGPEVVDNPERFINVGQPGPIPSAYRLSTPTGSEYPEYLFLVNGVDDDGNGYVDEGFDGLDNDDTDGGGDGDGLVDRKDPGVSSAGGEWEPEAALALRENVPYKIFRRPYPTPGSRAIELPQDVVVDLTTAFAATPERSRLPVDPDSYYVDIMIAPNGQVVPTSIYSSPSKFGAIPFYHFWLTERGDVYAPEAAVAPNLNTLPQPSGAGTATRTLKGDRRLVTLFPRTGLVVTNPVETFESTDLGAPYYDAQKGTREDR